MRANCSREVGGDKKQLVCLLLDPIPLEPIPMDSIPLDSVPLDPNVLDHIPNDRVKENRFVIPQRCRHLILKSIGYLGILLQIHYSQLYLLPIFPLIPFSKQLQKILEPPIRFFLAVLQSFSWWIPSGWEVVVVLVVLAIWLYSLRRLYTLPLQLPLTLPLPLPLQLPLLVMVMVIVWLFWLCPPSGSTVFVGFTRCGRGPSTTHRFTAEKKQSV